MRKPSSNSLVPTTLLLLSAALTLSAQHIPTPEDRTAAAFQEASKNPLELRAFLKGMPKGGELHFHLGGAVYAETVLQDAAEDRLCVNPIAHTLVANKGLTQSSPTGAICGAGLIPASDLPQNQAVYDAMVDAWSMRSFIPSAGVSGHDHFFSSPLRVGTAPRHLGEWVDEVATRAAAQNEQYLEIQHGTPYPETLKIADELGWNPDMAAMRKALLARGLRNDVALGQASLDQMEATRSGIEHCGTPEAAPACSVLTRYLFVVSRGNPPARVFAQSVLAFELSSADPRVVGVNFAQPEDGVLAMSEYHQQMKMLDFLHTLYPKVHISLHAGELSFGMVPPAGLTFHIREAVELGHAERIGHGVDLMYEADPHQLLQEMAQKHITVEINLTSNDEILGVTGAHHPLPLYLAAHVPVAFSTDDEGVSRIDITHEYVRAATEFGLSYLDLKRAARTSIEHSFLPGEDLWAAPDDFTRAVPACSDPASATCRQLRNKSLKAEQEWELEQRFIEFEATH